MKKLLSAVLAGSLVASASFSAFAANFSDLPSDHWAYSYVDTLVSSGTINGFEDGTFRPAGTVTRAEFVKMIGNGPTRRTTDFADVAPDHWAYEYIMTSGLLGDEETMFNPSTPITRGEVAVMLWNRAGAVKGVTVPEEIYSQGENHDAISWIYSNGIMTGNDNVNLRLGDTLTRAEATALIIRSRNVAKTPAEYSADLLQTAYKAFGVVPKEYSPDAKITNGELAYAASCVQSATNKPIYNEVSVKATFDHKYSTPLNMICRYALGLENDNAVFVDKNATVKDAIAAFMFATKSSAAKEISFDENGGVYPGCENESDEKLKQLKCAYQNGIAIDADLNSEITLKDVASLLIQLDALSGLQYADLISDKAEFINYQLNTDLATYPSNASEYAKILKGIPNYVYETPFVNEYKTPAEAYVYTNQIHDLFNTLAIDWAKSCSDKGVKISIIHNPTLILQSSTGFTFRTYVEIINKGNAKTLGDIIACADETIGSKVLNNGDKFYLDIDTQTLVKENLRFYVKDAVVTQIVQ